MSSVAGCIGCHFVLSKCFWRGFTLNFWATTWFILKQFPLDFYACSLNSIFSTSYWFKLITWCNSAHPQRDTISPWCSFEENTQMDSTRQWKCFCKQQVLNIINKWNCIKQAFVCFSFGMIFQLVREKIKWWTIKTIKHCLHVNRNLELII